MNAFAWTTLILSLIGAWRVGTWIAAGLARLLDYEPEDSRNGH